MPMSFDAMIEIIKAAKEGKKLQWKEVYGTEWQPITESLDKASFNFQAFEYRIQPVVQKPKEIWVYSTETANVVWEEDERHLVTSGAIHYREVIPEVDKLVIDALMLAKDSTAIVSPLVRQAAKKALEALSHADR